jgi:endonuclease I
LNKRYFSGNGGSVSGMNIEHSVAKSWWGGTNNNAYKDLYHLNPSDATANSARSNYPLGINNGSKFDNGSIKVGNNTYSTEYSGLCFEPLDEYKGDFARAYMYMFTCYEDLSWTGTIQEGHGRHSLCNSFRSFPPNTFGEDATSGKRRRRRAQGRRTRRGGSNEGIHP